MRQAPIILVDGDPAVNARSCARSIRAENLSPNTETAYLRAVARLADFLCEKGMPQDVAHIKREHLESFIEDRLAHRKPATANHSYRGLQRFFAWLVEEGEIDVDLDAGRLRVLGKGRRERALPIGRKTVRALDRYSRARTRHFAADESWLWLGRKGRLTDTGFLQMFQRRERKRPDAPGRVAFQINGSAIRGQHCHRTAVAAHRKLSPADRI